MAAPLVVHRTMEPPETRVAACTAEVKDRMAAWSNRVQTTSLRS